MNKIDILDRDKFVEILQFSIRREIHMRSFLIIMKN